MARGRRGITGPAPKPRVVREREGNMRGHALPVSEPLPPAPVEVPPPPAALGPRAAAEWERLVPILQMVNIFTTLDLAALATYCTAYERWWDAELELQKAPLLVETPLGGMKANPLIKVARDAMGDMLMLAREFGFTPAARTRIMVGVKLAGGNGNRKPTQAEMDEAECFDA